MPSSVSWVSPRSSSGRSAWPARSTHTSARRCLRSPSCAVWARRRAPPSPSICCRASAGPRRRRAGRGARHRRAARAAGCCCGIFCLLPLRVSISWAALGQGLGAGLVVSVLFALLPLLEMRRVSPLLTLRSALADTNNRRRDWWQVALLGVIVILIFAFAVWQTGRWQWGVGFGVALLLELRPCWPGWPRRCRGWRRNVTLRALPYAWRQGVANLHRPNNRTLAAVRVARHGHVPDDDALPVAQHAAQPAASGRRRRSAQPHALRHPGRSGRAAEKTPRGQRRAGEASMRSS
jgi:hypothetical protein